MRYCVWLTDGSRLLYHKHVEARCTAHAAEVAARAVSEGARDLTDFNRVWSTPEHEPLHTLSARLGPPTREEAGL